MVRNIKDVDNRIAIKSNNELNIISVLKDKCWPIPINRSYRFYTEYFLENKSHVKTVTLNAL